MNRSLKENVKVLVEGATEKSYFSGLKKNTKTVINIERPVNMYGGGYKNFIKEIRKLDYKGCIAIFIIIDLDTANDDRNNLNDLIALCKQKTLNTKIPYFLIGTNDNFEYFSCCHCNKYRDTNTKIYITKNLKYKTITEYKADSKIYIKLNTSPYSYTNALNKINSSYSINNTFFRNDYIKITKGADISIKIKQLYINDTALLANHSNLIEFFEIIGLNKK